MEAPRQKLMKERAAVVATTTFAVELERGRKGEVGSDTSYHFISVEQTSQLIAAREIALRLRAEGKQAFFVGGCVRDMLLGRPAKDFDVVTDARPEEVIRTFHVESFEAGERSAPSAKLVGAHFGVVLVRAGLETIEVATFRSEGAYSDGRHPDAVVFETDPSKDVLRRDFTINALLLDPETSEVIDYVGGRADLEAGVIRAIGSPHRRFEEDHLRMLRAIRFAARLGFTIDPGTLAAIRELAPRIHTVPPERQRDELTRILLEGGARQGFEMLDEAGLLHEMLPEIERMKGVQQPPQFHPEGDVWIHTLLMLEGLQNPTPELALGVLLHDVGKPPAFRMANRIRFDGHPEMGVQIALEILTRFRYPNDTIDQALALVANHMRFMDAPRMNSSTLKRFLRMDRFHEHLALHRLDCLGSNGQFATWEFVKGKLEELPNEALRPARLLTGEDLIAAGYKPGPQMKVMLTAVEDAQLEGTIQSLPEALALVSERFPLGP